MDQIFLTDLIARGIIGVNDWERVKPQEIVINLVISGDFRKIGASDDLRDGIDYRTIAGKVLAHAETAQRLTLEALAEDLARLCLEDPQIRKVRIRVEKPGAIRFSRSVGVEIERERP